MKISRNFSAIQQNQSLKTGQAKTEKGEPDRVTLDGSDHKVPDFIKDGKLLSQTSKAQENGRSSKAVGALVGGLIGTAASLPFIPMANDITGILIIGGVVVTGGIVGAVLSALENKNNNANSEYAFNNASTKAMQTTVAITTGNIGLL